MTGAEAVFVVPAGVDDPARVSGGNVYDRRVRDGLAASGRAVRMAEVADAVAVAAALAAVASGGTVLLDGLVAGWAPDAVEAAAARLRVVVLAHMVVAAFPGAAPAEIAAESRMLRVADRIVATSAWTAAELVRRGVADASRVVVATPGSDDGPASRGGARDLLCVGALAPHKAQDVLLDALARLPLDDWTCTLAGSSDADPAYVARLAADAGRLGPRVRLAGVLSGTALDDAYERAGLLVAPSRIESFGMAIADARRRGMPVIAAAVGGIPEAVAGGGALLVSPGDPVALASALERWMTEPALRSRLRAEASAARARAPRWSDTVARVGEVLAA